MTLNERARALADKIRQSIYGGDGAEDQRAIAEQALREVRREALEEAASLAKGLKLNAAIRVLAEREAP